MDELEGCERMERGAEDLMRGPPIFRSQPYETFMMVYYGLRGLEAALAVFGNTITILIIWKYEALQTTTNLFILSLAVSDLIGGLCVYPIDIISHYTRSKTIAWYNLCKVDIYMKMVSFFGNILGIFLIAVERFTKLHYPLRYPSLLTQTRAICLIMGSWIITLVSATLFVLIFTDDRIPQICSFFLVFPERIMMGAFITAFGVISVCTCALYIKIGHLALVKCRQVAVQAADGERLRVQLRVTKMLLYVLVLYYLLYLPHAVINFLTPQDDPSLTQMVLYKISIILWFGNTWCNPLVYAWKSQELRGAFKQLLHLNRQ